MKLSVVWFALVIAAVAAPVADNGDNDDCSQAWNTVDADSSSTATAAMSTATGALREKAAASSASSSVTVSSSTDFPEVSITASSSSAINTASATAASSMAIIPGNPSGISTPTLPDGTPGFPINDDHLKAPVDDTPVPNGAAIYTPQGNTLNCTEFTTWNLAQRANNLPSKFLKITPGIYFYSFGDPSTTTTIAFGFYQRGWTLDLRGVTFIVTCPPNTCDHRDSTIFYINQSEDFTLLGGTFWWDQGELYSQARLTTLTPSSATFTVEAGYSLPVWRTTNPRNQGCTDTSNPAHFTRPSCNFFYLSNYDFSHLDSHRTFTTNITSRAALKEGYVISTRSGPNQRMSIITEDNGGFHIKGLTSNGAFTQIGLNGKVTAVVENVWYVNPPPRPGFAPRVNGPTLSWGHVGDFDDNMPGEEVARYPGSWWQYTGCEHDLAPMANQTLPSE